MSMTDTWQRLARHQQLPTPQNGSVVVSILFVIMFLTAMIFGLFALSGANLQRARSRILLLQAQYAAESGADAAIAQLNSGNTSYSGTVANAAASAGSNLASDVTLLDGNHYKVTYSVSVVNGSDSKERIITAVGKLYAPKTASTPKHHRIIKVTVQRTSTTTASSILSRNIISIDSGVKNISGKDVYVNGYITMAKNTTNLIAENVTVAGRNTGASNCSIGGTGNLVKPSSFSTPGQTKTNLTLAYNNCISPPGNSSNADFNVSANQGTISTVQSTYIPWDQYMDNSYQNSPGGCSDWTSGSSPRSIPSTGNDKKTHYPDNGSNVSTSCGTSGDIDLGSNTYTIRNHAHIRANLCAASGCNPTFNNPDTGASNTKFVFVEGTINFNSVQTSSGSGPIVFIAYGADPASKASVCPLGGSIYLGNSSNSTAPGLFFLASNGICLDKTKFGAAPALGGIGGKNIFVATNPGTPFDLELDKTFPVQSIPIDLSWRAMRYQRL